MLRERPSSLLGTLVAALSLFMASGDGAAENEGRTPSPPTSYYKAKLQPPTNQGALLQQVPPGGDAFPEEKTAAELSERLGELGGLCRGGRLNEVRERLLAADFRGGRLTPTEEQSVGGSALEAHRATSMSSALERDRISFTGELGALFGEMQPIRVAEFQITGIEEKHEAGGPVAATIVRYDVVGAGRDAWRSERVGRWRMEWRRDGAAGWRVVAWTALADQRSRAPAPVFTEVTESAIGHDVAYQRQLRWGIDDWLATLDSVFARDSMGHHGVSVADVDGDGLDDFFVTQPAGFPRRLFRNAGDGTFEDITETSGLGFLDDASQAVFADVDNDGDEDLILVTRTGLLLFLNDGKGRFTAVPDAFRFKGVLRGAPTSVTMADFDRDGLLDLYVCTYGYFIGASEDKASTPTPYHDAQNGPPNVLLRNDGHGHFVDVTNEVGLDANNDRFSFAAAWADYDEDGWPDLLVANDFGRKNLYHNEGMKNGKVTFKDVAAQAGVEDYGAGMSATWLDYDNDGHLDMYLGNMWSAAGQRVTAEPGFMPAASPEVRDLYRRHARGNSLFRNRGDGTFEDVTLQAGAELGRWAWSSDAIDFDNDGSEDLFVENGMFTQDGDGEEDVDYDSFFWRQVVARSPLSDRPGTLYDDGWRAINRLLMADGEQARHERKVLLRNDGHGGFDEVAGSVGLDLDQDGRSFAVFDYDQDGRPDVVHLAPRSSPQLRLFHNDFAERNAALALRLTGTRSNRDAVGAKVTVETDQLRRTKIVQAGSGFLSQHSKELLFGLGKSTRIVKVEVLWPSGLGQTLSGVPLDHRVSLVEGSDGVQSTPFRKCVESPAVSASDTVALDPANAGTWMYRPFPAPDFKLRDLAGGEHFLSALRGKPALLLFWATGAPPSGEALRGLADKGGALAAAGAPVLAVAMDPAADEAKVRAATQGLGVPVMIATDEVAGAYGILSRYLFNRQEDLRLPTLLLVDSRGEIVKAYRDRVDVAQVLVDLPKVEATPAERLVRAVPFRGDFYTAPGERNYFQYSLDLAEQGFDKAALAGFERAAKLDPIPVTFYNLGTLYMKEASPAKARIAFDRALALRPDYVEANNSLGALLAQGGEVPAAIERFRAALKGRPDYADALNNLGYALFQTDHPEEAALLYQKALAAQPGFPEALNNLGILFGQQGDLERAEPYFMQAVEARPGYGEAANNLALVRNARGDAAGAIRVLQRLLGENPAFEAGYVTLARVYLGAGRRREGVQVLELLLQRNPRHPLAIQLLGEMKAVP